MIGRGLSAAGLSPVARLRDPRLWAGVATLVVIVAAMAYCGQLRSPFLEHDDWDFLLPAGWGQGYATPWQKTLTEGRWLNYWWYLLVGVHWSATAAAWAYAACMAAFAGLVSIRVTGPWRRALFALVVFFSPMAAELSTWPAALAASRVLLVLAAFALLVIGRRGQPFVLGLATFLAVMSYAGAAPVLLFAYVFLRRVETRRELALTLAIYLAAFALSILTIATLNASYHDHFGVLIEGWRHPHPARDFAGFGTNLLAQLAYFGRTSAFLLWPLLVTAIVALRIVRRGGQRRLAVIFAAAALVFAMDLGMAAMNGVLVPVRSMGWIWIAMALVVLAAAQARDRQLARVGWLAMAALLALGFSHWSRVYRLDRPAGNYIHAVGAALEGAAAGRDVVLVGDARSVPVLRRLLSEPDKTLRMAWYQSFGVVSRICSGAECEALAACARAQHVETLIFTCGDREVVYFRRGAVFP